MLGLGLRLVLVVRVPCSSHPAAVSPHPAPRIIPVPANGMRLKTASGYLPIIDNRSITGFPVKLGVAPFDYLTLNY